MKRIFTITLSLVLYTGTQLLFAQTYVPIPVTGFNSDIVAEAGTNAVAVTSTVIDGSNHVLHTQAFAAANGVGGGIINSGTFVSGTRTYQMNDYASANALYMSAAGNVANSLAAGTLILSTPASYTNLSILAFGTEGTSTVNVTLNYTDGTSAAAGTLTIKDWFNGTPFIFSGFGRLTRTVTGHTVDGLTTNPRMYAFDFNIPCADQVKLIRSVTFVYVPGTNISSRAVIMALSGVKYVPLTYTDVITDAVCGGGNGSIALTITGGNTPLTYAWNTTPVQTTTSATGLVAGTYTCAIRDANGCITNYTGIVKRLTSATITATANPAKICAGESTTLTATATGGTVTGYSWEPGTVTGNTIAVSPADTTSYIVKAKDAYGCDVTSTVRVDVKPTPTAIFTALPATVCLGTAHTLTFQGTASPDATYNWYNFAGATVQQGTGAGPYDILFNTAGNYILQLQVTDDGCVSTLSTQNVTVSQPPVVALTVSKTPVCAGESTTISFTGNTSPTATPVWNWGGGVVQNGSGFGPYDVRYQQTGNIGLTVTDGACTVTATPVTVQAIPVPVVDFSTDLLTGCAPAAITFTNTSRFADTYQWSFGNGQQATTTHPVYNYGTPGTYTVTLTATAQGQCSNTITKTGFITILAPPIAAFSAQPGENRPVEFKNGNFSFTNGSQYAISYEWDFGDGTTSILTNPAHKYQLPGSYRVLLYAINDIGCRDSISHAWYVVTADLILDIPNAFSPNGDGTNDRWNIDGLKARPNATTEVYNRWGQLVYKSIGYTGGWDGTRGGKPLPAGTYYYVIKTAADEKPYTGWVALLR